MRDTITLNMVRYVNSAGSYDSYCFLDEIPTFGEAGDWRYGRLKKREAYVEKETGLTRLGGSLQFMHLRRLTKKKLRRNGFKLGKKLSAITQKDPWLDINQNFHRDIVLKTEVYELIDLRP